MAESIVSSLLSQTQFSITSTDGTVASKLKVAKVSMKFKSNPHRSIKEDGSTVVDAKVILQTEITVAVYCQSVDDLRQVNDLLSNRSKLYTLTSKGVVIQNVVLDSENVKQSADVTSAYPIDLHFTEIILQDSQPVIVAQPGDSKGISAGLASISVQATQTVSGLVTAVKAAAADVSRQVIGVFSSG